MFQNKGDAYISNVWNTLDEYAVHSYFLPLSELQTLQVDQSPFVAFCVQLQACAFPIFLQ
jgi:hypothetical protein